MCVNERFFPSLQTGFNMSYDKVIFYSSFYPLHAKHFSVYDIT